MARTELPANWTTHFENWVRQRIQETEQVEFTESVMRAVRDNPGLTVSHGYYELKQIGDKLR